MFAYNKYLRQSVQVKVLGLEQVNDRVFGNWYLANRSLAKTIT